VLLFNETGHWVKDYRTNKRTIRRVDCAPNFEATVGTQKWAFMPILRTETN
jgi:hypothetical protein